MQRAQLLLSTLILILPLSAFAVDSTVMAPSNTSAQTNQAYIDVNDPQCQSPSAFGSKGLWNWNSEPGVYYPININPGGCPPNFAMTNVAHDVSVQGDKVSTYMVMRYWGSSVTLRCCPIKYRWVPQQPSS